MPFQDNLKRVRKSKQLSQEELAELLDVSRQAVSKWEQGICMPEAQMLLRLSEKLDVSLDELMSESVEAMTTIQRAVVQTAYSQRKTNKPIRSSRKRCPEQ